MADTVQIPEGAQVGVPIPANAKIGAAPTGVRRAKSLAYTYGYKAAEQLPLVGGIAGGLLGSESGPGAIGTAAFGGAGGEALRQIIDRLIFKDGPQTSTEAAKGMGKEAAIQAANQAAGMVAAKPISAFGKTMAETAMRGSRIPLLPSQAGAESALYTWGEKFLGNAIPSGGVLRDFQVRQAQKATQELMNELTNISKFKGTAEEMGNLTKQAVEKYRDTYKKTVIEPAYNEINKLVEAKYGRVPVTREVTSSMVDEFGQPLTYGKRVLEKQQISGLQANTASVKRLAIPLLRQLREQKALIDPKLLADSESILTGIVGAPKTVPFQVVQHSRSDLLAIGRQLEEALPGKRAGIVKRLIGGLDDSLNQAADNSGIPQLGEKVRYANRLTVEMHRRFDQQLIAKTIAAQKPEMISGYIRKAGLQEIRDMQGMLSNPMNRLVRARVMQDLMDASSVNGQISPYGFARQFDKLGEERAKQIFGPSYPSIKQLTDLFQKIGSGKHGDISAASLHNWAFIASLPSAAITSIATHNPYVALGTAGVLGTETAMLRGLAYAITNPAKSAKVAMYTAAMLRGSPYAADALRRLITSPDGGENEKAQ